MKNPLESDCFTFFQKFQRDSVRKFSSELLIGNGFRHRQAHRGVQIAPFGDRFHLVEIAGDAGVLTIDERTNRRAKGEFFDARSVHEDLLVVR